MNEYGCTCMFVCVCDVSVCVCVCVCVVLRCPRTMYQFAIYSSEAASRVEGTLNDRAALHV